MRVYAEIDEISRKTKRLKTSPVMVMPRRPVRQSPVEEWDAAPLDLPLDAGLGVGSDQGSDDGHDQENVGVEGVYPVLDPPGRGPAAYGVAEHSVGHDPAEEGYRHAQHTPARQHGQ